MEYKEALNKVIEAIKNGTLSIEEVESKLKGDIDIPIDITGKFHLLFCTKYRTGERCRYYDETNRVEQPTIKWWSEIIRLYMKEFDLTIDDVRAELDFLIGTLKGDKPSSKRLTIMYFVYYLLDDDQLSKFIETFVRKLNTDVDIIKCQCLRRSGEFIQVLDPKNPTCPVCKLPIV